MENVKNVTASSVATKRTSLVATTFATVPLPGNGVTDYEVMNTSDQRPSAFGNPMPSSPEGTCQLFKPRMLVSEPIAVAV